MRASTWQRDMQKSTCIGGYEKLQEEVRVVGNILCGEMMQREALGAGRGAFGATSGSGAAASDTNRQRVQA
jgi:hypothetical protein